MAATRPPSPTASFVREAWVFGLLAAVACVLASCSAHAPVSPPASRVYEILRPGQQPLAIAGAIPVVTFSAVSDLEQAVTGNQLPAGTHAVLYDLEVWPDTPAAEQRNPAQAARQALDIVRAHGLK